MLLVSLWGVFFFWGGGWILVSLRVFGWKILYLPIQVSLSTVHKETYKKMPLTTQKSPSCAYNWYKRGGGRWLRRHSVNRDSPHSPLFQRNSNAPINVNPVGRECGQRTGIWCLRLSPPSGFWSCEEIPGSEHLTLTDRSLVSIQKWLPSPSLEAFWKSHCWRKVWSFHLFSSP